MNQYILPDFLIIGTMKSGTTTLANYLSLNPEVHIPDREIHYFDRDENYRQGPLWYSNKLGYKASNRFDQKKFIVGEKTPTYSYLPVCADRIKNTVPNTKLIWIFRDPIKRSFSNYLHARKKGAESMSFRECVENEEERIKKNIFKGYLERSKYSIQVERFLNLYERSNMHFLLFENLINSPRKELNKIYEFLEIREFEPLPELHSNKTVMPLFPDLLSRIYDTLGRDSHLYKGASFLSNKLGSIFPEEKPSIPSDLVNQLSSVFAPYNSRLAKMTNLDLSVWETVEH